MSVENRERNRQYNMEYYGFGPSAMKKVRVCADCGAPSRAESHFCAECGRRLPDKTLFDLYRERHRICLICDSVLTEDMEFCPQCGMPLRKSAGTLPEGTAEE